MVKWFDVKETALIFIRCKRQYIKSICSLLVVVSMCSCAGSSEIISMSSRNVGKGESLAIATISANPTITPLCQENIDTVNQTAERIFANNSLPMNPVLSLNYMYGVTDYYESGLGVDFSLIGFTAILNNKIGFTDIKNPDKQKRYGFSYYNKSSFTRGGTSFPTSYDPFKMAHFETGNYFIMGWFIKDYEIILSPHIDLNYLMSRSQEHYYLNNGRIIQECHTNVGGNAIPSEITNSNLFFFKLRF